MRPLKNFFLFSLLMNVCMFSHASFVELENFGENPGELTAQTFIPEKPYLSVVVLLHGCVQNGVDLAKKMGLLSLAEIKNIALLVPQQSTSNNAKACFNWFSPHDTDTDQGESLSLKNMVLSLKSQQPDAKFYIVGLSAGAAMSTMMLANYPNLFTAGAIFSGIPFPCAKDLIQAISCMQNGPSESAGQLADKVRAINKNQSVWPSLSIWTGLEDNVVHPQNSTVLAQQWAKLTNMTEPPTVSNHSSYTQTSWQENSNVSIDLFEISRMGHGLPVNPNQSNGGKLGPYLLQAPLSATLAIAEHWKL